MFSDILSAVREWLSRLQVPYEVLTDRADSLRIIFETENALGELIVAKAESAPFRWVSLTVLDKRLDIHAEPVFCFHDREDSTAADILRALDRGAAFIASL